VVGLLLFKFVLMGLNESQPETCLHMGALEMIESPNIAIIQHTSGVLRVAHNLFETGSKP